jgi:hypothetical protein
MQRDPILYVLRRAEREIHVSPRGKPHGRVYYTLCRVAERVRSGVIELCMGWSGSVGGPPGRGRDSDNAHSDDVKESLCNHSHVTA